MLWRLGLGASRVSEKRAPLTRSEVMSRIGPKNTRPEMIVRQGLHARGFRFRLHRKDLPGRPDLILTKFQSVIFIHGCFWHAHENCRSFSLPKTKVEFWSEKLSTNKLRDKRNITALVSHGWRVLIIWECETRRVFIAPLIDQVVEWLQGNEVLGEIPSSNAAS